ncbi:hypothetical protein [Chamaesiphon sp. VAR_69_metabat_338]|uniref:hypothetical protein n=1 Tax=Chamaesiphon sp. VAR_69_metabat_338 TaxID=2964704 RepID=UPI00286DBAD8|nr:hypothetical protein [Chamaesiphon sp. VAR_69_metabat_338]
MDEMVFDESAIEIEEVVTILRPSMELELADILDLDIFDFDTEELAASNEHNSTIAGNLQRLADDRKLH